MLTNLLLLSLFAAGYSRTLPEAIEQLLELDSDHPGPQTSSGADRFIINTISGADTQVCNASAVFHSRQPKSSEQKKWLYFVNSYSEEVWVYWYGYDGALHKFGNIKPGAVYPMHTFGGHGFVLQTATGSVIRVEHVCVTVADYTDTQIAVVGKPVCSDVTYVSVASLPVTHVHVTFYNHYPSSVYLYWIDHQGKWKHYRTLQPGAHLKQPTMSGHGWVVTVADSRHTRTHNSHTHTNTANHDGVVYNRVLINYNCLYVATNDPMQTAVIGQPD